MKHTLTILTFAIAIAGTSLQIGCTQSPINTVTEFTTNLVSKISETSFGDKDFNVKAYATEISGKWYLWRKIDSKMKLANSDGKKVDPTSKDYFPLIAIALDTATELTDSETKSVSYYNENGDVLLFKRNPKAKLVRDSNLLAKRQKMPKGKRVANIGESKFTVYLINFGLDGLKKVAYATTKGAGDIVLVPSPRYGVNRARNYCIELNRSKMGIFIQEMGKLEEPIDQAFTPTNAQGVQVVEDVVKQPAPEK